MKQSLAVDIPKKCLQMQPSGNVLDVISEKNQHSTHGKHEECIVSLPIKNHTFEDIACASNIL